MRNESDYARIISAVNLPVANVVKTTADKTLNASRSWFIVRVSYGAKGTQ